jgi:hypothetical protein
MVLLLPVAGILVTLNISNAGMSGCTRLIRRALLVIVLVAAVVLVALALSLSLLLLLLLVSVSL